MTSALVLPIALPLAGTLLSMLWPAQCRRIGVASLLLTLAAVLLVLRQLLQHGPQTLVIGGWEPGLGIVLYADGLAITLLCLTSLLLVVISSAANSYFSPAKARQFWPLWLLLAGALNALFLASDLFNIYVTLELLTLTAVALTTLGGQRASLRGALRYLLFSLFGSMLFLAGVALIYTSTGRLDIMGVDALLESTLASGLAMALISAGLLAKSALLPMHVWLPPAHANAPAPVSAALSALVIKAAFYLLFRLWFSVFDDLITPPATTLLAGLGSLAILWGSWQAWQAERLKLMAAYSSVAQIGYLFLFLPLIHLADSAEQRLDLVAGLLLLLLTHACAKSALFISAGYIQRQQGHDQIRSLSGLASAMPLLATCLVLACIGLVGLPPSGAFLAKWIFIDAAITSGQWLWVVIIALGTLLAASYALRLAGILMNETITVLPMRLSAGQLWPPLLLCLLATVALGLGLVPLWELLPIGSHSWGGR